MFRLSMIRQQFPSPPTFTEANLGDLSSKVYFITGANTGIGKELARILHSKNAVIYVAARSESKARAAIADIQAANPTSTGRLEFVYVDLSDLTTIKPAAEAFLAKESRLDVLFNNAGVMHPPNGSKTKQGYELQLGTNNVAPFLLTKLLTPILSETAKKEPAGAVRVVWVASMATELYSQKGGVDVKNFKGVEYVQEPNLNERYGNSKAGNWYHGAEYARRYKKDGILSVPLNPGNLQTDLYRHATTRAGFEGVQFRLFANNMLYPVVNGAYTELFAGLSPEVTPEKSGAWVGPFGRFFDIRKDLATGAKPISEGGSGIGEAFWEWSEQQIKPYL